MSRYKGAIGTVALLNQVSSYNVLLPDLNLPAVVPETLTLRQKQSLTGRLLLAQLLDLTSLPPIRCYPHGKPYFADRELPSFSIAHSGESVFVLLGQQPAVGCDIEKTRNRKQLCAVAKEYFSATEFNWLLRKPEAERVDAFFQLWTLREAIIKQKGDTVWDMKSFSVEPERLSLPDLHLWHHQHKDLHIACCGTTSFDDFELSLCDEIAG